MEHSEETVAISIGLENLISSLKVWSLRMFLLLNLPHKLLIIKIVDPEVTLFPLEELPVLLLSHNLCFNSTADLPPAPLHRTSRRV